MTPKRVLVCGGRDWLDEALLRAAKDLLRRPPGRRGGYVIPDSQLKRTIRSIERRRARSAGIEIVEVKDGRS